MAKTSTARKPTSVHDSNAGHDFHVLWATRRIIELLNPATTLRAVKMEGVAAEDTAKLSATADHFLAADLTEYHGGEHFAEADRTIIAQLKYSTRHPADPWTGSRLRKRKGIDNANSVIERLAAAYQDLLDAGHTRDEIQQKATIGLVSNQPLHTNLDALWRAVQTGLDALGPAQVTLAQLSAGIPAKYHAELNKLYSRVGCSDTQFTDFLRILDLSSCGASDRMGQRLAVLQELAPSVPTGERDVFLRLTELVRQQALPENEHAPALTRLDVLTELKVFDEKELFPEPSAFNYPANPVATTEALILATALCDEANSHLLAHGAAGVGKSTTVQQVEPLLPVNSVTILYDCYADGKYYSLITGRHTLENALMQLSNELAVATGLPFLVAAPTNKYKLLNYFQQRLEAAARVVDAAGGLLVLIIDAADNSVIKASQESGSVCFVPYLWELTLPPNCRLLMTARTHRRATLLAPASTLEIELTGFDFAASSLRLRQVFPTASVHSAAEFHRRTGGNPRVQEYWLDSGSHPVGSYAAFLHSFRRRATTATAIIEDIIRAVVVEVPNPKQAGQHLATLVCLQRPIPLPVFAQACGLTLLQATNFCDGLKPGLLFEDGLIGFRDEDFETQLRTRPGTATRLPVTHELLGDHFLPLAATEVYAAQAVAEHFSAADRYPELIDLVLSGPSVAFIPDSALRLRIERRRLRLALQAAATRCDEATGAKLAVLAAESLRANEAVKNLVRADIELAAQFGEADSVADYFAVGSDDPWLGGVHYQLAAHYASKPEHRILAEQHLAYAHAWVRRFMRLPEHERSHWHIGDFDIACETEAIYWLFGHEQAYQQLKRWRPVEVRLRVLYPLLDRLAETVPLADLEMQLRELDLPLLAQAVAQAALWQSGHVVSPEWCAEVEGRLRPLLLRGKLKPTLNYWPGVDETDDFSIWPMYLAELFTRQGLSAETPLLLLKLLPEFPSGSAARQSDYANRIIPIHVACLGAHLKGGSITGQDLFPPPPPKPAEERYRSDNSYDDIEYRSRLNQFIALFELRAQLLQSSPAIAAVTQTINAGLSQLYPNRKSTEYNTRARQLKWLSSAISLVTRVADAEPLLEELANKAQSLVGRKHARQLWLQLGREAAAFPAYQVLAFRCLERAAHDAEDDNLSVADRWHILLSCAHISRYYDPEFSKDFYRRALDAAHQGVGDDVAYRLQVGAAVAVHLNPADSAAPSVANRLASLVEAYHPYVSDDTDIPLHQTLRAVTSLHPIAGMALAIRWDLLNLRPLDEGVISVAEAATDRGYWHPSQSMWLLKLCGDGVDVSRVALRLLDHLPMATAQERQLAAAQLSAVANWVATDAPLNYRSEALQRVIDWADTHQQTQLPAIKAIRQTVDFVHSLHHSPGSPRIPELSQRAEHQRTQAEEWEAAAQRGDVVVFEAWRLSLPYSQDEMQPYLLRLARRVTPAQRTAVLDMLRFRMSYNPGRNPSLDALAELLYEWRSYGPVQTWAATALPRSYALNLYSLTGEKDIPNHLEQFCSLPLANPSRAALLLPGIAEQLDSLNSEILCRVASALTQTCSPEAKSEFMEWLLTRMQTQLATDQKILPFTSLLPSAIPAIVSPPAVYAQFIWSVCGHPDKRVRWMAIHSARQLLTRPDNESFGHELLAELIRLSRTTTGLLPEAEEFYWQGARVWVLLLLDRLADEIPAALLPHINVIEQHAFDTEFPHAQIRELARRILLKLHEYQPSIISPDTVDKLLFCNRPKSNFIKRGRYNRKHETEEAFAGVRRKKEFKFDEIDTLEYWFRPLGEVFQQTEEKIAGLVERWITHKWGRNDAECEAHRLNDQSRYNYRLLRHYKHEDTVVDNLRMHLSHHGLMCAAGELVDHYSTYVNDYDSSNSPWEEWLANYLPNSASDTWLADWRGPTPLLPECWGELPEPWRRKKSAQFHAALGTAEPNRSGWIVVYGHYKFGKDSKDGDAYVSSVQVSPEGAHSLLWALHPVTRDNHDFPTFGLNSRDEDIFDGEELPPLFNLLPILEKEEDSHEKGIERHDTFARDIHCAYPCFSQDFIARGNITALNGGRQYQNEAGTLVAECEAWDDDLSDKHNSYSSETRSSGFRLWVRQDTLLAYLTSTGQVLLMQATLSRNTQTRDYSERKNAYDLGKRRLALLHADGTLETVAGRCPLGPTDTK